MRSLIRSKNNWFQLLTAAVVVGGMLQNSTSVSLAEVVSISSQASYTYINSFNDRQIEGITSQVVTNLKPLIDPLGRVTGCAGELLSDYTGFSIAVYEADPSDPTGTELKELVPLTRTEVPDIPSDGIPLGLAPNREYSNPYFLTNGEKGSYSFLLDPNRGQLDAGRTYILVVNLPPNSTSYQQRRTKITINERNSNVVSYSAISLDGKPIRATDDSTSET